MKSVNITKKCKVEFGSVRLLGKKHLAGSIVEMDDYSFKKLGDQVSLIENLPVPYLKNYDGTLVIQEEIIPIKSKEK